MERVALWISGYFSTSHNTSLFLSTHQGHIPLSFSLSLSDALSIHCFGRGGVTLSPGGVNIRRITFSTPISHIHTHFQHRHTHTFRYIYTLSLVPRWFFFSLNEFYHIYIFAQKWFLNSFTLFPFFFFFYRCLCLQTLCYLSLHVCTSLPFLSLGCLNIFWFFGCYFFSVHLFLFLDLMHGSQNSQRWECFWCCQSLSSAVKKPPKYQPCIMQILHIF